MARTFDQSVCVALVWATILTLNALPARGQELTGEALARSFRQNVVHIVAESEDGDGEEGFGFIVGERGTSLVVATANHVVRDRDGVREHVTVRFFSDQGQPYAGRPTGVFDEGLDLAFVVVADPPLDHEWRRDVAGPEVERKEPVWFVGRAGDWFVPVMPGTVTDTTLDDRIVIEDLEVMVGTSGAPLIAETGLVGMILSGSLVEVRALTFDKIRKAIQRRQAVPEGLGLTALNSARPDELEITQPRDVDPVFPGQTLELGVIVHDRSGRPMDDTPDVEWSTSNPSVATVTPAGVLTARAPGQVEIVAKTRSMRDTAVLTIHKVPVDRVEIRRPADLLKVGRTVQLDTVITDRDGSVVTEAPLWSSSNHEVATVTPSGLLALLAPGSFVITATADNVSTDVALVALDPRLLEAQSLYRLAVQRMKTGQLIAALEDLEEVRRKAPGSEVAWRALVDIWRHQLYTLQDVSAARQLIAELAAEASRPGAPEEVEQLGTLVAAQEALLTHDVVGAGLEFERVYRGLD